ncbi:MAG: nucleotide exchange factor GrpE [Minisyncoccia bacterium]
MMTNDENKNNITNQQEQSNGVAAVNIDDLQKKIQELETELEKIKNEKEEYLNGWKRAKADLINYKKEEETRFREFSRLSLEALMSELINVIDSFDFGLTMLKDESVRNGIMLIKSQFVDILKKFGLEEIFVKAGDSFNSEINEAVLLENSDKDPETILEVLGAGYKLNGKVIRPVKVKVSKGPKND